MPTLLPVPNFPFPLYPLPRSPISFMAVATKSTNDHPTAVVSPTARIAGGCHIGPYSIIGDEVEL